MSEKSPEQSGGVNISGIVGKVGGDIVGRDKITAPSGPVLEELLRPLQQAIEKVAPEARPDAQAKLDALKEEAAKGKNADDGVLAKLIDGFVALVPAGAGAVVSAFATPVLGALAGPVTTFVLDKLRGK